MLSVLKMSFILLFLTLFQAVATNSYSQSVTISVKTDQAPLTDLFAIIEKQSDFLFFYVDSDVKNVKVSVNATDKSIENILSQALRNTSLKYSIEGRNINVFNKNIVAQQTKKRITGVVKDAEGNAIIGALSRKARPTARLQIWMVNTLWKYPQTQLSSSLISVT